MAIQNFLSGGYYGKLGATVGQRWKNKRTIRTYVVPSNPRTPTQQANRNKFANAVTFAQMGMQMNYYCTLFDDPNFTKWNYRMKVARELKNAGLTDLDLIPLYPISFVPSLLITEISIGTITGQKHISFATPDLNANTDRVFSIMFAIYDESDRFLGYKLYLGYYYASNPGYLEVDVDDVNEINDHCYVRLVTNDDENSATDLIGSPRLQVSGSSIDIHDFNTTIRSLEKSATGIKITFAEIWKGVPDSNSISAVASFVSNGSLETATLSQGMLSENNGYCSCFIPYATSDNQHLPAFPSGSQIVISNVVYDGSSWQIENSDQTQAYSDSDLTRQINATPTWNASDTGDITFKIAFGGTVAAMLRNYNMICSGRLGLRTSEAQNFNLVGTDEYLVFTCTGDRKQYPMQNGDKISLTAESFVCNGVTYTLAAQDVNLRNAITTSYFIESGDWYFGRDGGGSTGDELQYLEWSAYFEVPIHEDVVAHPNYFTYVEIIPSYRNCMPDSKADVWYLEDSDEMCLTFRDNYEDSQYNDQCADNKEVRIASLPSVVIDGITYTFTSSWVNANVPHYISGWDV